MQQRKEFSDVAQVQAVETTAFPQRWNQFAGQFFFFLNVERTGSKMLPALKNFKNHRGLEWAGADGPLYSFRLDHGRQKSRDLQWAPPLPQEVLMASAHLFIVHSFPSECSYVLELYKKCSQGVGF